MLFYNVFSFICVCHTLLYIVYFPPQKTFDSLQSTCCDVRRATTTKKSFTHDLATLSFFLSSCSLRKINEYKLNTKAVVLQKIQNRRGSWCFSFCFFELLSVCCPQYRDVLLVHSFITFFLFLKLVLLQMTVPTSCTQNHNSHMKAFSKLHNFQYVSFAQSLSLLFWTIALSLPAHINKSWQFMKAQIRHCLILRTIFRQNCNSNPA